MNQYVYLVLFDKTYGGLFGHVDRAYSIENEAELYCTAQNNTFKSFGLDVETWYIELELNSSHAVAKRVLGSKYLIHPEAVEP